MAFNCKCRFLSCFFLLLILAAGISGFAGVSRTMQEQYRQSYANKAMVLKVPVYSDKQFVFFTGKTYRMDDGSGIPRYKVGDQVRILSIDFSGDVIKFRISGITTPGMMEIHFKFDADLKEDFPNKEIFDRALQSMLTEGLKYSEIDDAKRAFLEDQFDRSVKNLAESASVSRDMVFQIIAPDVPAYQAARKEIDGLKNKIQDLSGQLAGVQSENRKLESQLKEQQAESARMKSANAVLQEKMSSSLSQVSKLGDELRDAKGSAQGYQKELANLQRSLNLKIDAGRDLAAQIADLGQVLKKLQKENDALNQQLAALRASLEAQQAANARLTRANEELKAENQKMEKTIATLTSNENSLAGQYVLVKKEKEKLEDYSAAIRFLNAHWVDENTEGGVRYGKVQVCLNKVAIGYLEWRIPAAIKQGESRSVEAIFSAESIDYVKMAPEEKRIMRTFGDTLRVRMQLVSGADSIQISSSAGKPVRQIGERDRSTWEWALANQGTQNTRILLAVHLINKHSGEIPLFQQEFPVMNSNAVWKIRNYLQPIPLSAGFILGILLFAIISLFRRNKTPRGIPPSASSTHIGTKQL
jgi:predicted nuclease with TOPRIM domain